MVFFPAQRDISNSIHQTVIQHKYTVMLIITNFITNYLFLFQYKFYSDDWYLIVNPFGAQQSYGYILGIADRPIYFSVLKFQAQVFQDVALLYHIAGFISTSVIIILIYLIAKKLVADFGYQSEIFPFLVALLYCVLFNKDEMYPWALVALGVYSILYMVSFYTYIHKEKKYYFGYSLITYTLALFTYESGIVLPVIFFFYDLLLKNDFKRSFVFAIPLTFNLLVRKTDWFGFGHTLSSNGFGQWGVQSIISNFFDFLSASLFIVIRQVVFALHGLQSMDYLIIALILVNLTFLSALYKIIDSASLPRRGDLSFAFFLLIVTAAFSFPYILRGGLLSGSLPTRSFEFIDIGIAFLLVFTITYIAKPPVAKIIVLLLVGIGIFLCQGLFMNWVVSGNIQDDVYKYIGKNADEISTYDYVYFNTTSYVQKKPNTFDESVFYPIAKLYYQYIRHDPRALEQRIIVQQQKLSGSTLSNEYDRYFNAKCLDHYVLAGMLSLKIDKFDKENFSQYLIYGNTNNVPVSVTNKSMIIQQPYPDGENITVERSRIFEINYRAVYPEG